MGNEVLRMRLGRRWVRGGEDLKSTEVEVLDVSSCYARGLEVRNGSCDHDSRLTCVWTIHLPLPPRRNPPSSSTRPRPFRPRDDRTNAQFHAEEYGVVCEQDGGGWELHVQGVERSSVGE